MKSSFVVMLAALAMLAETVGCSKNSRDQGSSQSEHKDSLVVPRNTVLARNEGDIHQSAESVNLGISVDSLSQASSPENDSSTSTYFGLYVLRADKMQGRDYHEVLLVGRCSEAGFRALKDEDEPTSETLPSLPSALIFKHHRAFVPFYSGKPLGQCSVSRVSIGSFDCSNLVVGLSSPPEPIPSNSPTLDRAGFAAGKEQEYSLSFAFVIEAPWFQTHLAKPSLVPPIFVSDRASRVLTQYCYDEFRKSIRALPDTSCKVSAIRPYLVGEDTAYVLTAVARTDSIILSLAIAACIKDHTVEPKLEVRNTNEPDSWGSGHVLLDVLDIDGDGNAELVFMVGYYEATGIEIYKLEGEKYKRVFDALPWGC